MQADLFDTPQSTAIYPNRRRDKERVERLWGLPEHGESPALFYTHNGSLFAHGYTRVVYGDHGYCQLAPNGLH